jgi:hypothetical protein
MNWTRFLSPFCDTVATAIYPFNDGGKSERNTTLGDLVANRLQPNATAHQLRSYGRGKIDKYGSEVKSLQGSTGNKLFNLASMSAAMS